MRYHLIVYVPVADAANIRSMMAAAEIGRLGNYDSCSFSCRGIGRFRPLKGANPAIGSIGKTEEVAEERIEVMVEVHGEDELQSIIGKIRAAHPYNEPAIHVLPMIEV